MSGFAITANNNSKGYATGLDMKIHGEFIPGIESWANLSFLKTEEDILDDFYYDYYNTDGELIQTGYTSQNTTVADSTLTPRVTFRDLQTS